jgi:hypothetical protein
MFRNQNRLECTYIFITTLHCTPHYLLSKMALVIFSLDNEKGIFIDPEYRTRQFPITQATQIFLQIKGFLNEF